MKEGLWAFISSLLTYEWSRPVVAITDLSNDVLLFDVPTNVYVLFLLERGPLIIWVWSHIFTALLVSHCWLPLPASQVRVRVHVWAHHLTLLTHANPNTAPTTKTQPSATPPHTPIILTPSPTPLYDLQPCGSERYSTLACCQWVVSLMPTSIRPCWSHDKGMQTLWELYSFYFLCLDYVIHHPVYKSDPLYGLDLSLLLKGLTLQRAPCL